MSELTLLFVSGLLVNNFVLVYFLGLCPVVGVTGRVETALRLGLATTFVMVLACLSAWTLNTFVLERAPYLRLICFIVAIASAVQIVEMVVKKLSPALFRELGIFLPLIASNSQVLGLTLFQTNRGYSLLEALVYAIGAGLGITLVLGLMASMRVQTELSDVPAMVKGPALVFLLCATLSMAFMGFAGLFG
jgi:electron transport complex protein RnfA